MINNTTKDNGVTFNQHVLQYNNGKGDTYLLVLKANGSGMVNSADEFELPRLVEGVDSWNI